MLSGDFQRRLRKLNRNLRIWCGDNPARPAGIYQMLKTGEYEEVCGIDKNYVPEYVEWNPDTSIKKGGWRRALKILLGKGLIDKHKAQKVFNTDLDYKNLKMPKLRRKSLSEIEEKANILAERAKK